MKPSTVRYLRQVGMFMFFLLFSALICLFSVVHVYPLGYDYEKYINSAELENLVMELTEVQQELQGQVKELENQLKDAIDIISEMERKFSESVPTTMTRAQRETDSNSQFCKYEPSYAYEKIRRKIENGVTEIWYYMRSQLNHLKNSTEKQTEVRIDQILEDGGEQQRSILTDIYNLSLSDGYSSWREDESKKLSKLVQQRLRYLQNPKDCNKAKKIVCNFGARCGYGCQAHHVAYCMIVAYATQRTLILESKGWNYAKEGWERFFQPLSNTCLERKGETFSRWKAGTEDVQVVQLPIVAAMRPHPGFMPLAIPEDISKRLIKLHGHPIVWWLGQIMTYIQRPQPAFQDDINKTTEALGFKSPIVGMHVRRTDKVGTEAAFHEIEEYMVHAEEFFQRLERRQEVPVRRIYLATDEASLLKEAQEKYPNYVFVSDNTSAKLANLSSRYSEESLRGIILDIHFLSRSDFLVCTFSSQVCRIAYEMMQNFHADAASNFRSLDDIYFFAGMNDHQQTTLYEHKARNPDEIDLQPGDAVGVAGNHWDGYSKGINLRLDPNRKGAGGLYPSYKVEDKTDTAKMPTYPEAEDFH